VILSHFQTEDRDEVFSGVSRPIYFTLKNDKLGLEQVVANFKIFIESVTIPETVNQEKKYEELTYEETTIIETDKEYFDLVKYNWLAGNKRSALNEPHQLVLSEKRAKHYFPNLTAQEIIGKTVIYNDTIKKIVSGVVENLKYPSEFVGQEFFLVQERDRDKRLQSWGSTNGADKVYLVAKDQETVDKAVKVTQNLLETKWKEIQKEKLLNFSFNRQLGTMPLLESHFATYMKESGAAKTSGRVIYSLIVVALFLLLLACINYINLTTSQLPQRSKEIGIRKTLGGSRKSLIMQMMCETSIIVLLAAGLSFFVSRLGIGLLGDLITEDTRNYADPMLFIGIMSIIIILTILIAGLYPSWMMSKLNAIEIFRNKGHLQIGKEKINLRKALIVFQFVIAQVFIVGAIIISQQLNYVINKDMGFNKDAVILSNLSYKLYKSDNFHTKKMNLFEEIKNIPGVQGITMGKEPLSISYSSGEMKYFPDDKSEPVARDVFTKTIDSSYLNFYDIKLIAGNNLILSDTTNGLLINETASKAFGFKNPQDAVGKFIGQSNDMYPIRGVIKDFHAKDFYQAIDPTALLYNNRDLQSYSIRLDNNQKANWPMIIANIHHVWNKFFPSDEFNYKFYDDTIFTFYKKEQQLLKLTNISTGIAILISCLGLFGLITLSSFQRSKEIGIRKVLGATVAGIVGMLSKDFVKMVLLAILIASPIVYWACTKRLESFAYRVNISWVPFIVGGFFALLAAMITISYQAIKAAKTNPVDSLKDE